MRHGKKFTTAAQSPESSEEFSDGLPNFLGKIADLEFPRKFLSRNSLAKVRLSRLIFAMETNRRFGESGRIVALSFSRHGRPMFAVTAH